LNFQITRTATEDYNNKNNAKTGTATTTATANGNCANVVGGILSISSGTGYGMELFKLDMRLGVGRLGKCPLPSPP